MCVGQCGGRWMVCGRGGGRGQQAACARWLWHDAVDSEGRVRPARIPFPALATVSPCVQRWLWAQWGARMLWPTVPVCPRSCTPASLLWPSIPC